MSIAAEAFQLDDLTFPLATAAAEFALDEFQWPGVGAAVPTGPAEVACARDAGRVLVAGATCRVLVAADSGRTVMADRRSTWAGTLSIRVGELRSLGVDFAELAELEEGDELTGTPTVTVDAGSGILVSTPAVDGTVVEAPFDAAAGVVATADTLAQGGPGYTDYSASFTADTVGGSTLSRSVTIRVEE